ncbi:MAG: hypothetical protein AABX01_06785 [Candidatus Micrarchaeota archaeon]
MKRREAIGKIIALGAASVGGFLGGRYSRGTEIRNLETEAGTAKANLAESRMWKDAAGSNGKRVKSLSDALKLHRFAAEVIAVIPATTDWQDFSERLETAGNLTKQDVGALYRAIATSFLQRIDSGAKGLEFPVMFSPHQAISIASILQKKKWLGNTGALQKHLGKLSGNPNYEWISFNQGGQIIGFKGADELMAYYRNTRIKKKIDVTPWFEVSAMPRDELISFLSQVNSPANRPAWEKIVSMLKQKSPLLMRYNYHSSSIRHEVDLLSLKHLMVHTPTRYDVYNDIE